MRELTEVLSRASDSSEKGIRKPIHYVSAKDVDVKASKN